MRAKRQKPNSQAQVETLIDRLLDPVHRRVRQQALVALRR